MIKLESNHNYVAFFLSLGSNLNCSYCINLHNSGSRYAQTKRRELSYRDCNFYGNCNPCDLKVKTNHFQQAWHTSVDIINTQELS